MFDLSGKTALVAGGAGYLGDAVCAGLAAQGAAVMVADVAADRAEALANRLNDESGRAAATRLDVGQEESINDAVSRTVSELGRLDIVVNAAMGTTAKSLEDLTGEDFDRANRINLTGAFLLARRAAAAMTDGGSMVFFTSMYGQVSPDPHVYQAPINPNPIEYGVGKAGVIQLVRYLAVHWGERGIRVNAVSPGPFPNPAVQSEHPDFVSRLAKKSPMGRIGRQNEIVGAIVFLASDEASYVTGDVLNVDGGWTAW